MNREFSVFVVDDAEANRRMLESALGQHYNVESFESGPACIRRMAEKIPGVFLLDVDMPEMDGYTLCRHIKSEPALRDTPVIFISALGDLESRLTGYDAGGHDFIVKPYKLAELKQKLEVLKRSHSEKSALETRLEDLDTLSSLILSNLDEYAVLVKFLRSLNGCNEFREIASATLDLLSAFHLEGALQLRLPDAELTLNQSGETSPLEASIINHVRSLGSIAEFKSRAIFNYDLVSVLVNNMPLNDPELCGRLRDHLAMAAETVNARVLAMLTRQENSKTKAEISDLLQILNGTIREFGQKYEEARFEGSETTRLMLAELDSAFASLGMQEEHEERIKDIIQSRADELIAIFDFSSDTGKTLQKISEKLTRLY